MSRKDAADNKLKVSAILSAEHVHGVAKAQVENVDGTPGVTQYAVLTSGGALSATRQDYENTEAALRSKGPVVELDDIDDIDDSDFGCEVRDYTR